MANMRSRNARILKDIKNIKENPIEEIHLAVDPVDMAIWYYIIEGSVDTPFHGGFYLGKIKLAANYPFNPPDVQMITPSGRFKTNCNICFSYTNYHPETWSCMFNPSHVAIGLLSFMNDFKDGGVGSITTTHEEMKMLAKASIQFNLNNEIINNLFPEIVSKLKEL